VTKLLATGASLQQIKRYLGHVSERMTEHYAKVALSDIDDVLQPRTS
jgi:site-specific recombinase XerD